MKNIIKKFLVMVLSIVIMASVFPVCVMAAGNSPLDATTISFDNKVSGTISDSNGADFYKFVLPSSGKVTIKTQTKLYRVSLGLYYGDDATECIETYHLSWDDISKIGNSTKDYFLTAGTYFYRIVGANSSKGDYSFTVSFDSANESIVEYFNGTNNSLVDADSVEFNKKYTGFIARNDTIDFYKFNLPLDTEVSISSTAYVCAIYYYIYNSNGECLDSVKVGWDNVSKMSYKTFTLHLTKGTYYFVASKVGVQHGIYEGSYEFSVNVNIPTPKPTGWVKSGENWYYYNQNGTKLKGWQKLGAWFYFDSKGIMQTGWVQDGGKWYYMSASGAMATGWVQDGGKWYYMSASGAMATGWVQDGGKWYYMSASGAMATGWIKDGGKWYFMSASGAMATGWVKSGTVWYYMDPSSGAMVSGTSRTINGKKYNFDSTGKCTNP